MTFEYRSSSPEETLQLGKRLGSRLRGGDVIAFRGGLGAGKTTMTRGIALGMGLKDDVSSPTFALVNEYRGGLPLYHFDMYRVGGGLDLESTGFFDYLSDDCVIAVEWSENIENELPKGSVTVELIPLSQDERVIKITGDERFEL